MIDLPYCRRDSYYYCASGSRDKIYKGGSIMYHSIRPGQVWLDTEGKRIQAHGGSVMYVDGTYYFYGENKEKTDGRNGICHWGVRCYSSKYL